MRFLHITAFIFFILPCIAGCGAKSDDANLQSAGNMEISVDFSEVHLCSRISPEITVAYAPKGTKFYDVNLMETGTPGRMLGGGTWPADGSGIIPEGALTRHYTGPCPPKDREVEYVYVVGAMPAADAQPLSVRYYRFKP